MPEPRPIDRAFFRETEGGETVFFPWGVNRTGYQLTGEATKERAERAGSLLIGSTIAIGTWTAYALQPLFDSESPGLLGTLRALAAPGAVLLLALLLYAGWASRFVEGCPASDLRIPREERLREAAELAEPWKVTLIGVVLVGLSALLVWLEPNAWWLGLLSAALGAGAVYWASLLKRAARDASEASASHSR